MAAPFFSWNILCVYIFAWECVYLLFCIQSAGGANCIVLCITNGGEDKKCNNYGLACCNGLITSSSANLCIILIICIFLKTFMVDAVFSNFIKTIDMIKTGALSSSSYCLFQRWTVDVINFDEWTIMSAPNSVGLILRKSSPTRSLRSKLTSSHQAFQQIQPFVITSKGHVGNSLNMLISNNNSYTKTAIKICLMWNLCYIIAAGHPLLIIS